MNLSYIGKTKRHLAKRVGEHEKDKSAIGHHLQFCTPCRDGFNVNKFKIIDTGSSDTDCKIKEALHIKSSNPILNKQLFQSGSSFVLNVFT